MLYLILIWAALSVLGSAQTTCKPQIPPSSGRVVLTYTPYVTPQTPPLSTVYRQMVTAWTYAVDCRYVSIEQVDNNYIISGAFSGTPTTVDALTITRIGCIQQSSMVTRRDVVRGFPVETNPATTPTTHSGSNAGDIHKRAALKENALSVATQQAAEIPPDALELSVRAYNYLVQVNTALYALNLYNTGFNMSATCTLLNDPIAKARLIQASVDPAQAAAIICYAAQYGLYFDMSNTQLLSDLLSIIYSIEVKSGFSTNTTVICEELSLNPAGLLGIDTEGVQSYICGRPVSSSSSTSLYSATTSLIGTAITGTGIGSISTTGPVPPYANSSAVITITLPVSSTWTNATSIVSNSNYTDITYSAIPYGTSGLAAASDSFSIVFPNTTAGVEVTGSTSAHVPPSPTAQLNYVLWTTSTTVTARFPRY